MNQGFLIQLERPSQIANNNLVRINRIEAIASSFAGKKASKGTHKVKTRVYARKLSISI